MSCVMLTSHIIEDYLGDSNRSLTNYKEALIVSDKFGSTVSEDDCFSDWVLVSEKQVPRTNNSSAITKIARISGFSMPIVCFMASSAASSHPLIAINGIIFVFTRIGVSYGTSALVAVETVNVLTTLNLLSVTGVAKTVATSLVPLFLYKQKKD